MRYGRFAVLGLPALAALLMADAPAGADPGVTTLVIGASGRQPRERLPDISRFSP